MPPCGVLAVDERVIFLAILVGVGKGYLDVFALHVHNGVKAVYSHVVGEQILQSMAAQDALTVIHDGEPCVEVSVVAEHGFYDFIVKLIVFEQRVIWFEEHQSARFIGRIGCIVLLEHAFFEHQMAHFSPRGSSLPRNGSLAR